MTTLSWRCLPFPNSFLISFSRSASRLCPFPTLQISPQNFLLSSAFGTSLGLTSSPLNSVYTFFWSKSNILLCLNCSILWWHHLPLALFASIRCFSSSITVFNRFLFTLYFLFNSLTLRLFFNPSSPLTSLSIKSTSCLSFFISPSVLRFLLRWFFFLCSAFFNPIRSAIQVVAALVKLFVSAMLLIFKYFISSLTLSVWTLKTFLSTYLNIMPLPVLPSTIIFFNGLTIAWCSWLKSPSV